MKKLFSHQDFIKIDRFIEENCSILIPKLSRALQKMYPEAVSELKKSLSVRVSNLKYAQSIDTIYKESGIEGVLKLLIQIYSSTSFPNNYNLAKAYSELGDKEMAINYLEKAFIMHDPSVIHILNNPSFIDLYSEPGFKAIVKKLGLSVYMKVK